ncbi:MAG: ABC transporter permease [Clostridia bacterium]|nr:ABC transporter permease [Clostridia bacterium]MBO4423116.1 ABC transporter permease [Clostridia bacterium]
MAGKSGRTISATPNRSILKTVLSWEGALVVIFIAVIIAGKIMSPSFTLDGVMFMMPQHLCQVFIVFPMAFVLIMGEIDISVGSIACLSATTACLAANAGLPLPVVILVCLLTGLACGSLNGFVLTKWPELPPMIVTLGTQIIFRGIAEVVIGAGSSLKYDSNNLAPFAASLGPIPVVFIAVVVAAVLFMILLSRTTFGRRLYAIGSNRVAAKYAGIGVNRMRFIVYALAGVMAALCALFLLTTIPAVKSDEFGKGFEMNVIAMCVFGGIATTGGKGNLLGAFTAGMTIVCLRIALGLVNVNDNVITIIIGVLLIVSVLISGISRLKGRKPQKKKAATS